MINKDILRAKHEEELKDADEYNRMAEECPDWHCVFNDIANEEHEHAHMIEHILNHLER